jgi:hypothetical protein
MKKAILFLSVFSFFVENKAQNQTNIISTNTVAEQVMLGNYNPATYQASVIIMHPDSLSNGILKRVSADSLHAYLSAMAAFKNRNTGSDTLSNVKGIGAARRWALKKFQQFSSQNQNRLIPSYLQFDQSICNITKHRDIFAVLPGTDTTDKSIVLIEGHLDSRCAVLCDTACLAQGMEDNGSGSALVLELARVMSKYSYKNSIVFMLTISEEQGLYGAEAFANYCFQKGIKVKAILNNDVIGGVICGQTSSPPSCPGAGNIDSTHVRLFSYGGFSSFHKGLARFVKLEYKEQIRPYASVPMTLHVMTPEDRTGRGGDHIPFRMKNYTAIRLTSANEHGDANVTALGYNDRQHTSADILGVDTDSDQIIDSFFVDFNYLARNAVINGNAAAMAAIGPKTPDFTMTSPDGENLVITITQQAQYLKYRVGLRTNTYDWDTVFTCSGTSVFTLNGLPANDYIASVASFDNNNVESLFSKELLMTLTTGVKERKINPSGIAMLGCKPNPADEATMITILANTEVAGKQAEVNISDVLGRKIFTKTLQLDEGINEVEYNHGYHYSGTFICSVKINGAVIQSQKLIFKE